LKIVWQSFEGRYSDSPRVLYEAWISHRADDEHVWLADQAHVEHFPADTETVTPYTAACVAALESADVVVASTHTDVDWRKKAGALYLQTWHGTPLKRIHHDVRWAPVGRLQRLDRDVARWDVLLSPNAASTPVLRRAFRYDGEIVESGYPRNDVLVRPEGLEVGRRVRASFGIDDHTRVVLYTPTWRDDVVLGGASSAAADAHVQQLADGVPDDTVLLVRAHSLDTARRLARIAPRVIDVSPYPDVAHLYLAADAMITDYSSTMFDFAVTGKPLVFFVHDYERFRDEVRGFYFDLEDEAPGPLVRTAAEVWEVLAVNRPDSTRYRSFQRRYCNLEDGAATDRVLSRLLPEGALRTIAS